MHPLLMIKAVKEMELERNGRAILEEVWQLKQQHKATWRGRSQWYWLRGLLEEVVELALSLMGLHKGPPEWELEQIAAICLNWLEMRKNGRKSAAGKEN